MCTLAAFLGVSARYPLIVVANRDEFLGRPSAPPSPWPGEPGLVAGRDLVAGGTWLGCRTDGSGRVVAVLNRRPVAAASAQGPGERSRGLLCLDALRSDSNHAFLAGLDPEEVGRYAGFSLFVAEPGGAWVLDNERGPRRTALAPGLSLLTNLDLNDGRCARLASTAPRLRALRPLMESGAGGPEIATALHRVMGSHAGDGQDDGSPLSRTCVHAAGYGTRSCSVILVDADGAVAYFHADGPPCTTRLQRVLHG